MPIGALRTRRRDPLTASLPPSALPARRQLSTNALSGTLPARIFAAAPPLDELMLAGNSFSGSLPEEWAGAEVRSAGSSGWRCSCARGARCLRAAGAAAGSARQGSERGKRRRPPCRLCAWLQAQTLQLSGNPSLVGPAFPPAWLARPFPRLKYLHLSDNAQLTGTLPAALPSQWRSLVNL